MPSPLAAITVTAKGHGTGYAGLWCWSPGLGATMLSGCQKDEIALVASWQHNWQARRTSVGEFDEGVLVLVSLFCPES
ncbi:hypothetical protein E2C01_025713 [Portunus trituberculatus]|uniref:Uncharacterized protein n=1 Tax=Portunus trituberculatus TaxID=210409 RepID=A0A5B7EH76_PORTR|nr:hypothetical protein [Portunus trituberculatus]